jgi:PAS domain-containing protein
MKQANGFPLMSWRARPDMSFEDVSDAWVEFTGMPRAQALEGGWSRAIHPEDLPRWLDVCLSAFDERRAFEIEYRLRSAAGAYRRVLERAEPRYAGGAFAGFDGYVSCNAGFEFTTGDFR